MWSYETDTDRLRNLGFAFTYLMNESGKLAKQDILRKYADLPYFKDTLHFLYNNMIVTNISKKKLTDPRGKTPQDGWACLLEYEELLDYLQHNSTGRLQDLSTVHGFISNFEQDEFYPILEGIVTKDIPLGVSASTLNKVFGKGFVPQFDVMKGSKFDPDKMVKDGKLPVVHAITAKLDGTRNISVIDDNGEVTMYGRSGKLHEGYSELTEAIKSLGLYSTVLDGEMLIQNPNNLPSDELFTLTQSVTRKKGEKTDVVLHVYDMLPRSEFLDGKSKLTYEKRREELKNLQRSTDYTDLVEVVPVLEWTNRLDVIQEYTDAATRDGLEGIMLNSVNGYYTTTRTKQLLKVKEFHTMDLVCTGAEEETRGGKLGAIIVDYKGNEVRVGSGFNHAERDLYWKTPELIVGNIVEVQYFETSVDKTTGKESLRFPTYLGLRVDKTDVSYD